MHKKHLTIALFMAMPLSVAAQPYTFTTLNFQVTSGESTMVHRSKSWATPKS